MPTTTVGIVYYEKQEFDRAIKNYTKAIELRPDLVHPYNNRGNVYNKKGEYERAIKDYDAAIERNTDLAEPYYNRGMVFVRLQEWEKAKEDLTTANDKQENIIIGQFRKEYENVADFEQKHAIKLPEDIAAMLTPSARIAVKQGCPF